MKTERVENGFICYVDNTVFVFEDTENEHEAFSNLLYFLRDYYAPESWGKHAKSKVEINYISEDIQK
jgi:hypothetical protein